MYLKDHVSVRDKIPDIRTTDIRFVITLPDVWDDSSHQFISRAAKMV